MSRQCWDFRARDEKGELVSFWVMHTSQVSNSDLFLIFSPDTAFILDMANKSFWLRWPRRSCQIMMSDCFVCVLAVLACWLDPLRMYKSPWRMAMSLTLPLQSRTDTWFVPNTTSYPLSTILVTDNKLILKSGTSRVFSRRILLFVLPMLVRISTFPFISTALVASLASLILLVVLMESFSIRTSCISVTCIRCRGTTGSCHVSRTPAMNIGRYLRRSSQLPCCSPFRPFRLLVSSSYDIRHICNLRFYKMSIWVWSERMASRRLRCSVLMDFYWILDCVYRNELALRLIRRLPSDFVHQILL